MGGLDLVDQPVHRLGLGVYPGPPERVGAGVNEVAVVVPLDVADVVLRQHREDLVSDVGVALGDAEVDHLLEPRLDGGPAAGRHDPLGMRASDVGVLVDHLGLEPQAELHAELLDPVDQRVEPVRPDVAGHHPVAETRVVVTTGAEPAVVEHVALDADGGGLLGELQQRLQRVIEVDGLPDVDRHGAHRRRVLRPRPQIAVEPAGDLVEADAVGPVEPGAGVGLARGEDHLAGEEELAAADDLLAGEVPLGEVRVVAGPADVHAPHLAVGEAEAGHTRVQDGRGVGAGAALAAFADVGTHREGAALRHPLLGPSARLVLELGRDRRDGIGEDQVVDAVLVAAGVDQRRLAAQHTARGELEGEGEFEAGRVVAGHDGEGARAQLDQRRGLVGRFARLAVDEEGARHEPWRPRRAVGPRAAEAGTADPAGPVLGKDGQPSGVVDHAGGRGHHGGEREGGDVVEGELAGIRAPVEERGEAAGCEVDDDADPLGPQGDEGVDGVAHGIPPGSGRAVRRSGPAS